MGSRLVVSLELRKNRIKTHRRTMWKKGCIGVKGFNVLSCILIVLGILSRKAYSEEAAKEVSNLICETQEDGTTVLCQFKLQRKESIFSLKHCDGDEFCVEANVKAQTKPNEKPASTTQASTTTMTTTSMESPKTAAASKSPPAKILFKGDTIVVGSERYQRPFTNYPTEVSSVLEKWLEKWPSVYDEAAAHLDLGLAHQKILELDPYQPLEQARKEVLKAVNAVQQAESLYEGIRHESSDEKDRVAHHLALCYVAIGETYSMSPDDDQYVLAMDYFIQAERLYQKLLSVQESKYLKDSRVRSQAEIDWATCCLRMGSTLLSADHTELDLKTLLNQPGGDFEKLLRQNPQQAEAILSDGMGRVFHIAGRAEGLFLNAEKIFGKAVDLEQDVLKRAHLLHDQANTVQHLGTTAVMKSDLKKGAEYYERALILHEKAMSKLPRGSVELDDTNISVAEVLYSLANTYLQLGRYDASKERYQRAMDWYESYNVPVPPQVSEQMPGDEKALREYERALEEYNEKFAEGVQVSGSGESLDDLNKGRNYEKNDGYEGDLHASMGVLYMARGDMVLAASHLTQAINLYSMSGEREERSMAGVMYNLATLHFESREFQASADYHSQALDIYRVVVGEGKNPMQLERMGMPDIDISKLQQQYAASTQASSGEPKEDEGTREPKGQEQSKNAAPKERPSSASMEAPKATKGVTRTSWDGDTIVVGSERYKHPFKEVPSNIRHMLKLWPKSWPSPFDEAAAYLELGLAHRSIVEHNANMVEYRKKELTFKALNAMEQALFVYQGIRQEDPSAEDEVAHNLAACYFAIGETYALSPDDSQYALATDYFFQAEKMYQELLSKKESKYLMEAGVRLEAEIGWAHCCLRVGVSLLTMDQSEIDIQTMLNQGGGDLEERLRKNPEQAEELERVQQIAGRAQQLFLNAEKIFRKALEIETFFKERLHLERHLASALQNLGTAAIVMNELEEGAEYSKQALVLYEETMEKLTEGSLEHEDGIIHIAEVLYSLSDTYLQLGQYEPSKEMYRRAMNWYERYNIAVPIDTVVPLMGDEDETLREYERAMDDYNEMFAEGVQVTDAGGSFEEMGDEPYYQRDDGYEGDLHASLGSLYMAKGDLVLAGSHLTQAINLYGMTGEQQERSMADTKFNMSLLHFRNRKFKESADLYDEALEVYRIAVGPGKNPMQVDGMGMPEMDLSFVKKRQSSNDQENSGGDQKTKPEAAAKADAKKNDDKKNVVHESMIDLTGYLQSLANTTKETADAKPAAKDEL